MIDIGARNLPPRPSRGRGHVFPSFRLTLIAASACLSALFVAACAPSSAEAPGAEQWSSIELEIQPAELGAERVGALIFRGGLELSSGDANFGGLSGLEILDGANLLAITDSGSWFRAELLFDANGALIGLDAPHLAPMRDEAGELFENKTAADAEGLAQLPDGRFAVSFEQSQTIRIYDLNRDGPIAAAHPGPRLSEVAQLPPNQGLEALAAAEAGDLVIGAEGARGPTQVWRAPLGASEEIAPIARYRLSLGYALVGLDRLPDGAFVALERAYAPVLGARTRIARFVESELGAGESIETEQLAHLGAALALDNFEAIAAAQLSDGTTRLYILSDDNFSDSQRTLLYAFDIDQSVDD